MWYWNGWVNLWWCWLLHKREGIKIYQDYSWICINFCLPVFRLQLLNERKSALGTSAFDESESDGEAEKPKKQDLGGLWIAEFTEFWAKKWPGCWEEQLAKVPIGSLCSQLADRSRGPLAPKDQEAELCAELGKELGILAWDLEVNQSMNQHGVWMLCHGLRSKLPSGNLT
jgi:hypothetical protein